ncbi:hypothetical protein Pelo_8801 [Pelomyxa schiedti]|nr:hypothetical protein Pelo_8801 [Pelomyxa schiedti]
MQYEAVCAWCQSQQQPRSRSALPCCCSDSDPQSVAASSSTGGCDDRDYNTDATEREEELHPYENALVGALPTVLWRQGNTLILEYIEGRDLGRDDLDDKELMEEIATVCAAVNKIPFRLHSEVLVTNSSASTNPPPQGAITTGNCSECPNSSSSVCIHIPVDPNNSEKFRARVQLLVHGCEDTRLNSNKYVTKAVNSVKMDRSDIHGVIDEENAEQLLRLHSILLQAANPQLALDIADCVPSNWRVRSTPFRNHRLCFVDVEGVRVDYIGYGFLRSLSSWMSKSEHAQQAMSTYSAEINTPNNTHPEGFAFSEAFRDLVSLENTVFGVMQQMLHGKPTGMQLLKLDKLLDKYLVY